MNSKKSTRIFSMTAELSGLTILLFLNSAAVLADPPAYQVGAFGGGIEVKSNTSGGASGGGIAQVGYRDTSGGDSDTPTHALEADARVDLGSSRDGFTTGVEGRVAGFIGGTYLDTSSNGCDVYGGVGGKIENGLHLNRPGQNTLSMNATSESGLMCQWGDVMLQMTPAVGLGTSAASRDNLSGQWIGTDSNFLRLGGRARLVVDDAADISAEFMMAPSLKLGSDWASTEASVNAQVKAGDWAFTGYVKGVQLRSETGAEPNYAGGEGGFIAARAFE